MAPRPAAEVQPELRHAPGWRRFLAPYYTSTLAVLPIYALARWWFNETGGSAYSRVGSSDELWEKVGSAAAGCTVSIQLPGSARILALRARVAGGSSSLHARQPAVVVQPHSPKQHTKPHIRNHTAQSGIQQAGPNQL